MTIPEQMFELYKYKEDYTIKKKFDCVLTFIAYAVGVEGIVTPSAPCSIFDEIIALAKEYIEQPLNSDLIDLYYGLKIGVKARPKIKRKNSLVKFSKCLKKNNILVQHNDVRAGDILLLIKGHYPEKNIIHYGYCHSISEYHIALVCSKLFNINSHLLCIDKDVVDKERSPEVFIANHMFINQWKKPSKKEIKTIS